MRILRPFFTSRTSVVYALVNSLVLALDSPQSAILLLGFEGSVFIHLNLKHTLMVYFVFLNTIIVVSVNLRDVR